MSGWGRATTRCITFTVLDVLGCGPRRPPRPLALSVASGPAARGGREDVRAVRLPAAQRLRVRSARAASVCSRQAPLPRAEPCGARDRAPAARSLRLAL